jgi:hypothetical protein
LSSQERYSEHMTCFFVLRSASSNLSYTYLYLMREFWYSGAFFVCNNSSCHELDACSQDSLVMMIRWLMMVMMV